MAGSVRRSSLALRKKQELPPYPWNPASQKGEPLSESSPPRAAPPVPRSADGEDDDPKPRVLIFGEHRLFAEAVGTGLVYRGIEVVGVARTVAEVEGMVDSLDPSAVLITGSLSTSLRELMRRLSERHSSVRRVVAMREGSKLEEGLRPGLDSVISCNATLDVFVDAVTRHRAASVASVPRTVWHESTEALLLLQLTPREEEILCLLVEGLGSHVIAERLSISKNTERSHIQSIFSKLGVHSRLEAASFALRQGLYKRADKLTPGESVRSA